MATPLSTLRAIAANDPNGGTRQPTIDMIVQFRDWIIDTYGYTAYQDYYRTDWEPQPEV